MEFDEDKLQKIKDYALERKIPIILDCTLEYIFNVLKNRKVVRILEIGSAVGYSAIQFSRLIDSNGKIDTIEIEDIRVAEAKENVNSLGLDSTINIIYGNALEEMPKLIENGEKYDFIFIDAAKGKYLDFYNYALQLLSINGIIIADNVLYKGMVLGDYSGHKHRTAVTKLRYFLEYIMNVENIKSEVIDIGDGISISYNLGGKNG